MAVSYSSMDGSVMNPAAGMRPITGPPVANHVGGHSLQPMTIPAVPPPPHGTNGLSGTSGVPQVAAPTSADACLSIVHSLMCHRQGGESESFAKRYFYHYISSFEMIRIVLNLFSLSLVCSAGRSNLW